MFGKHAESLMSSVVGELAAVFVGSDVVRDCSRVVTLG